MIAVPKSSVFMGQVNLAVFAASIAIATVDKYPR